MRATAFETPSPMQSSTVVTEAPSSSDRRLVIGVNRSSSLIFPPGRPRWLASRTRARRSRRKLIVGRAARIRESSEIELVPGSKGTLKSTRTRTRLSSTGKSRTVIFPGICSSVTPDFTIAIV